MKKLFALIVAFTLSSCASYSVTEGEIQNYLDSRATFERTVGIKGLAWANVKFSDIKVGIGRVSDDRVNLDAKTEAKFMISGQPEQEVDIDVSFSAIPFYDKEEGAIYLKDLNMESLDVSPYNLNDFASKQLLTPIVDVVGKIILSYPVYRLKEDDFKQSLIKSARPEMLIENHSLIIQM